MKRKLLVTILMSALLLSNETLYAKDILKEQLEDASAGSIASRFIGGFYWGAGFQGTVGSEVTTSIDNSEYSTNFLGFLVEGGVYGLFNPIRNFADIEVGLNAKYNTGLNSDSGKKKFHPALFQSTIYSGFVFRFDKGKKALSIGVSKALYMREYVDDEMKTVGLKEHDIENGLGLYVEYQRPDLKVGKGIAFTRFEVEKFDVITNNEKDSETIASFLVGFKY